MSARDVRAIIEERGSVQHCGVTGTENADCAEHHLNPTQALHWAAECPQVLADARTSVRRGLAVFPLPAGGRVPGPGWQRLATLDEDALPQFLADGRNIGVACRASRVVGLDLDVHADDAACDGITALQAQLDLRGEDWPDTFTVRTPHRGLHLYFRVSPDCTIGSSSGGRTALGPGIDVRGPGRRSGGYLVGPGSVVGGTPYAIERDVPVAPLPAWIANHLNRPRRGDAS